MGELDRKNLTISEFCYIENISKSTAYRQIKAGNLSVIHVGRKTLVPVAEAERWAKSLESAAAA